MTEIRLVSKLEQFRFVREEVKHEYEVLGSRLSSYITSQSFLVSAYAVSLNNADAVWGRDFRLVFPLIVCFTGLVLSWRAQPGIQSVVRIIQQLHDRQNSLYLDPAVKELDPTNAEFMIETHRQSLQFTTLSAYIFSVTWAALLVLAVYLRIKGG